MGGESSKTSAAAAAAAARVVHVDVRIGDFFHQHVVGTSTIREAFPSHVNGLAGRLEAFLVGHHEDCHACLAEKTSAQGGLRAPPTQWGGVCERGFGDAVAQLLEHDARKAVAAWLTLFHGCGQRGDDAGEGGDAGDDLVSHYDFVQAAFVLALTTVSHPHTARAKLDHPALRALADAIDRASKLSPADPAFAATRFLALHAPNLVTGFQRWLFDAVLAGAPAPPLPQPSLKLRGNARIPPVLGGQEDSGPSQGGVLDAESAWVVSLALSDPFFEPGRPASSRRPGAAGNRDAVAAQSITQGQVQGRGQQQQHQHQQQQQQQQQQQRQQNRSVGVWTSLYVSSAHGLAHHGFKHHVGGYRAPSVLALRTACGRVLGACVDVEWQLGCADWGGAECCAFQVLPQFAMRTASDGGSGASGGFVSSNESSRSRPVGMGFGPNSGASPPFTLWLDGDMLRGAWNSPLTGEHQSLEVVSAEVWGCGGKAPLDEQMRLREWSKGEATRRAKCKFPDRAEWADSPDKALLDLGGVKTEHAER